MPQKHDLRHINTRNLTGQDKDNSLKFYKIRVKGEQGAIKPDHRNMEFNDVKK